jgi:ABC-type sugar transport system ATPase subunit
MLVFDHIDKRFGATHAVKSVSLTAKPGTVLALAGENGAGKSTLIKMLSGVERPDRGAITLDGHALSLGSISDARQHGIASAFQELTLIPSLTVERNLFIGDAPRGPLGAIDPKALRRQAVDVLARYDLAIRPEAIVADLPLGQQQQVEIVRAVKNEPRVLLLDEATSALSAHEVAWLRRLTENLREKDTIILFISHRWDEIVQFCNRVAVMRNGELVGEADTTDLSEDEAIRLMTGQNFHAVFPERPVPRRETALVAEGLASRKLRNVTLQVRQGEILGLGGLVGQGQGALLEALFGAHALDAGTIRIGNKTVPHTFDPRQAIRLGVAYVPQERKSEGLLLDKSIAVNMTLAILSRLCSRFGVVDTRQERRIVDSAMGELAVRARSSQEVIGNLSGGNQQKILLQKWLFASPSVLLLNDVTRGVDIGTKLQIFEIVAAIARRGVAVIWYSTDTLELVGLASRVLVMFDGQINAELSGDAITSENIVRAAITKGAAGASTLH